MERLLKYLKQNKIKYTRLSGNAIKVDGKTYQFVDPKRGIHFDKDFHFTADDTDRDRYVYYFGGRFYWLEADEKEDPTLKLFKYIGSAKQEIPTDYFLGVHGGHEMLNGSGKYKDWAQKAKFLGVSSLGLADKNTLSGVLKFQQACEEFNIKPIIGATYTIHRPSEDYFYDVTFFVKNEEGWQNLLRIDRAANVDYDLKEQDFLKWTEGLIMVLDPKEMEYEKIFPLDLGMEEFYFKVDTVEYENDSDDEVYLKNLKKFFHDDRMKPLPISDAYYLDKEYQPIKFKLNVIRKSQDYICLNQYFKSKEEYFDELYPLFGDENKAFETFEDMLDFEFEVVENCNFKIRTGERHLPKYKMTPEEKKKWKTPDKLFWHILEDGLEKRNIPEAKIDEYLDRLDKEVKVLYEGRVVDYFLITWDIINATRKTGRLTGFARGSAGGCLVSYLMGITQIDPFPFDLIFERFLNRGRVKKSLPDIDSDFASSDRPWVKAYMEKRFGETQVCSVGTFTKLQLKSSMSDLYRQYDNDFDYIKSITKKIGGNDDESDGRTMTDLMKLAVKNKDIKGFVKNYPEIINDMDLILQQPKAVSVHACAMIIFPEEKTMWEWCPMRYDKKKKIMVSQLEGEEMETIGFLKQDILGVKQLEKIKDILDLIKKNWSKNIDIYTLPLDDKDVYKYFRKGWNSDIFQFGSKGLTDFCRILKPRNYDDLVAGVALYRPGAMENHFHTTYCKRKDGIEDIDYMWGSENITKNTYGLYIYQEQIMQLCVEVGGFNLVEADSIRKALGKKKLEVLKPWKEKFLNGAIKIGCPQKEAEDMWEMMLEFAKYSFNLSHSVGYSMPGYVGQWFKVHYPIEFWTVAFKWADMKKDVPRYLSEIHKVGNIQVLPPDINVSTKIVNTEFTEKIIVWGFTDIKNTGEGAADQIVEERKVNGDYKSFDDFLKRSVFKGSKVTKRNIEGLVLAGAFDRLNGLKNPSERQNLLLHYYDEYKVKVSKTTSEFTEQHPEWWWKLKQKEFSGIAFFDYPEIGQKYMGRLIFKASSIASTQKIPKDIKCYTAGFVTDVQIKNGARGDYAKLYLESNYEFIPVTIWSDRLKNVRKEIEKCKGSLVFISGIAKFDNFQKRNVLHSNEKSKIKILK
jgi:DNA polymerase-3 subunit alpha